MNERETEFLTYFVGNLFLQTGLSLSVKKNYGAGAGFRIRKRVERVQPFTEKVIKIIQNIPEGKVMTYGQIARVAGSPRAARQVVRILHSMSHKHHLPWHRVINSKGQISIQHEEGYHEQLLSLEAEGVEIGPNGVIDLGRYQFHVDEETF